MYVEFDKRNQSFELKLPQKFEQHYDELQNALMDEFAYEPINLNSIEKINQYILNWFSSKGINLE